MCCWCFGAYFSFPFHSGFPEIEKAIESVHFDKILPCIVNITVFVILGVVAVYKTPEDFKVRNPELSRKGSVPCTHT